MLKNLFNRIRKPNAREILHSQHDWIKSYLNGYLNRPIIAVTGQYTPLVIGFMVDVRPIGEGFMPCPVVCDYVSLNTQLALGRIWPYSEYILQTLCKLSAQERWVLINTVDSFPRIQIPTVGDAPTEVEYTYEQYIQMLQGNNFFELVHKQTA